MAFFGGTPGVKIGDHALAFRIYDSFGGRIVLIGFSMTPGVTV